MRANPRADWRISDVEAVCREYGIRCAPAKGGGSHHILFHPSQRDILTIPSRRPIKPVHIRKLVRYIDAVKAAGP
jgi:predicted RNA binding protein YcfA (HicA-like mRNA interferase family)